MNLKSDDHQPSIRKFLLLILWVNVPVVIKQSQLYKQHIIRRTDSKFCLIFTRCLKSLEKAKVLRKKDVFCVKSLLILKKSSTHQFFLEHLVAMSVPEFLFVVFPVECVVRIEAEKLFYVIFISYIYDVNFTLFIRLCKGFPYTTNNHHIHLTLHPQLITKVIIPLREMTFRLTSSAKQYNVVGIT